MKNTMKRIGLLFSVIIMAALFTMSASAKEIVDSGECGAEGDDINWVVYDDGVEIELVISGKGKIDSLAFENFENVNKVFIEEGITSIGEVAFLRCTNLQEVVIANSVTEIGRSAFAMCTSLKEISLSRNISNIGASPFSGCTALATISIDKNNNNFCVVDGVLFSKDMKNLIQYPAGNKRSFYEIPDSIENIGDEAFADCNYLANIMIGNSVSTIGECSFAGCENLTEIYIPGKIEKIKNYAFLECANLTDVTIGDGVKFIGWEAFSECSKLSNITMSDSVELIAMYAFFNCDSIGNVYYQGTEEQWRTIILEEEGEGNQSLTSATIHFLGKNIYNLGEETYSFKNYGDKDSAGGHCFGMSVTSSGYYLGILEKGIIDVDDSTSLYSLEATPIVKAPICHLHAIQGSYRNKAIIAGGTNFKYLFFYNADSDWQSVIDYVKQKDSAGNYKYNDKGNLMIAFSKKDAGAHATNFLRYEKVNGQDRIYIYDNNFPTTETYLYLDSNGKIKQAPVSTFNGSIDCVAALDIEKYFSFVDEYDKSTVFYANLLELKIYGANETLMCGDVNMKERVMFELPEDTTTVTITPLVDNATFTYMDKEYSFGEIDEDTYAEFTLSTSENDVPEFEIVNAPGDESQEESEYNLPAKIFELIKAIIDFIVKLLKK